MIEQHMKTMTLEDYRSDRDKWYDETMRLRAVNADLLVALEAAQEELRLIRMKDCDVVYQPGLSVQIDAAIAKAKEQGT